MALDQLINFDLAGDNSPHQPIGVIFDRRRSFFFFPIPIYDGFQGRVDELQLKKNLEGTFPGQSSFSHIFLKTGIHYFLARHTEFR